MKDAQEAIRLLFRSMYGVDWVEPDGFSDKSRSTVLARNILTWLVDYAAQSNTKRQSVRQKRGNDRGIEWLVDAVRRRDADVFHQIAQVLERQPPNEPLSTLADPARNSLFNYLLLCPEARQCPHSVAELRSIIVGYKPSDRTIRRLAREVGIQIRGPGRKWPSLFGKPK